MEQTVEALCNQLARHRLLDGDTIRGLRQRWRGEARESADDAAQFVKWLVANRHATEFQLDLLKRGLGEQLALGEYVLVERIGQGRMAGVYKALHQQTGLPVAVKVLPPSKANHPQMLARFQREARLATRLNHANVVRTFQRGQTPAGLNYLVMEFLDGETFEAVLTRRGKLPVPEAVHVASQALQGLQHLFEEGLVHRDLKPANLMVVPRGQPGEPDTTLGRIVKILDIGLGRALFDEGHAGEAAGLTTEGSLLGTPNYMAPEQARTAHLADIRSDVYSVGCILYQALSGGPPFPDTNFMRQMLRHATEAPRPLRQVNPAVPDGLQAVVDVMLAKDPAQRFPTPAQAVKALKDFVASAPPDAPRPAEAEPRMRSYLTWLATNVEDVADDDAPPTRVVPQAAVPPIAPVAAVAPRPVPVPAAPPPAAVLPLEDTDAAEAEPPPTARRAVVVPRYPSAASGVSRKGVEGLRIAWKRVESFLRGLKLTLRDVIAAAFGAAALLLLEGGAWFFVWLIGRLFR